MAATRQKKVLPPVTVTREDAELAFANYAGADARQQQLTAKMDEQITKIREKFGKDLTELTEVKVEAFELIQAYAVNNRDVFGKKKSMDFTHGIIGFRTGTPKLKLLSKFTWEKSLQLLKYHLPAYVRNIEEPAKDRLLADRELPEVSALFTDCGIRVDQDESFFVEPKKEVLQEA